MDQRIRTGCIGMIYATIKLPPLHVVRILVSRRKRLKPCPAFEKKRYRASVSDEIKPKHPTPGSGLDSPKFKGKYRQVYVTMLEFRASGK